MNQLTFSVEDELWDWNTSKSDLHFENNLPTQNLSPTWNSKDSKDELFTAEMIIGDEYILLSDSFLGCSDPS